MERDIDLEKNDLIQFIEDHHLYMVEGLFDSKNNIPVFYLIDEYPFTKTKKILLSIPNIMVFFENLSNDTENLYSFSFILNNFLFQLYIALEPIEYKDEQNEVDLQNNPIPLNIRQMNNEELFNFVKEWTETKYGEITYQNLNMFWGQYDEKLGYGNDREMDFKYSWVQSQLSAYVTERVKKEKEEAKHRLFEDQKTLAFNEISHISQWLLDNKLKLTKPNIKTYFVTKNQTYPNTILELVYIKLLNDK